jgi:hypothetical protein
MGFPVPPDVRGVRSFELVMGQEEMLRTPFPINDLTQPLSEGEWGKLVTGGGVTKFRKLEAGVDLLATPAVGGKVCWDKYVPDNTYAGQSDVIATKLIDALSGTYQAKTKLYDTGASYGPGYLLVPIYDAVLGGILAPLDPSTATTRQIQSAVGKVIEVKDGQLHYESPAL